MFSVIKGSDLPPEELRKSFFPWEAAMPAPGRKAFTGNLVQEVQRSREGSRSLRFASLEWGASSGQPGSEGMCLLLETSGSLSQNCCISEGHGVTGNNDLLHRPAKRKMLIIHFCSLLSVCEDFVVASQLYYSRRFLVLRVWGLSFSHGSSWWKKTHELLLQISW